MKTIIPRSNISAAVVLPGSKSITHRALITASLASGTSRINGALRCEDTAQTAKALGQLGAKISRKGDQFEVQGLGMPRVFWRSSP